jgi:hypothetical protein
MLWHAFLFLGLEFLFLPFSSFYLVVSAVFFLLDLVFVRAPGDEIKIEIVHNEPVNWTGGHLSGHST